MNSKDPSHAVRRAAYKWLARRDYSQYELKKKLLAAQFSLADVESVLSILVTQKLVDDARFTAHFIRLRREKGYGPKRILFELRTKGICEGLIAEQLKITDNAWLVAADAIWRKHFGGRKPIDIQSRVRQWRFLINRGFTQEQINSVIPNDNDHDYEQ